MNLFGNYNCLNRLFHTGIVAYLRQRGKNDNIKKELKAPYRCDFVACVVSQVGERLGLSVSRWRYKIGGDTSHPVRVNSPF